MPKIIKTLLKNRYSKSQSVNLRLYNNFIRNNILYSRKIWQSPPVPTNQTALPILEQADTMCLLK